MENNQESYNKKEVVDHANETSNYVLMSVGIFVGMIGVVLRFVSDSSIIDIASNTILIIGIIIGLKSVFNILK